MAIQATQVYCTSLVYICFMIVFFGLCIFLMAFVADFEMCLSLVEDKIIASSKLNEIKMDESNMKLRVSLNHLVRFHTDIKQLRFSLKCIISFQLSQF